MQLIISLGNEALELACALRRPKYGRYIDNSNEFIWIDENCYESANDYARQAQEEQGDYDNVKYKVFYY
ncbi:MAG: hypothetical protein K2X81_14165 [Candidatus Obscuribacterales bacterium]|nr:hypothetical protein [Candidatus Obscuribacterales bacterium]